MNRSKFFKLLLAGLFLVGGAILFYNKVYLPKSNYEVYHASKGSTAVEVFGIGELDAKDIYPVGTATGGTILSVETDQGRYIKKGDVIATLDPVDLHDRLARSNASLVRAKIDFNSAKEELSIAKEQSMLSLSTYEKDLSIYKANGISRLAYEKSKTAMLTAKTQVALAQSKVASMKIHLEELQYDIEGMNKRLAQLTILSPVEGYVIEKTVQPGQSVPPSFMLVKIVDTQTLWIKAWIDERISGKVKVGQKAKIVLRSHETVPYDGIVRRIGAVSDAVTQEREVDVGFTEIPEPFYMNEQAEVSITVETFKNLYKIPLRYLRVHDGKKGVWVSESGKAHFIALSIVAEDGEFAGVNKSINNETDILIPNETKKPLFEGSSISI